MEKREKMYCKEWMETGGEEDWFIGTIYINTNGHIPKATIYINTKRMENVPTNKWKLYMQPERKCTHSDRNVYKNVQRGKRTKIPPRPVGQNYRYWHRQRQSQETKDSRYSRQHGRIWNICIAERDSIKRTRYRNRNKPFIHTNKHKSIDRQIERQSSNKVSNERDVIMLGGSDQILKLIFHKNDRIVLHSYSTDKS